MITMEGETVYNSHDDSHIVMSEKVQTLAGTVYQEFERMISKYDEDVVKDLMPLVVNILECLDLSFTENQEHEVEVELLREDNEQLVTQYEREKQLRKVSEQKLLEVEDDLDEDRKQCQTKVESLESIVRMFELKTRNASDHATRMEDKADELKKEYSKLHERYTELFKSHMDYMERTKILCGTDRLDQMIGGRVRMPGLSMANISSIPYRSSGPVSYGFSSLDPNKSLSSPNDGPPSMLQVTSLKNELQEAQVGPDYPPGSLTDRGQTTDTIQRADTSTATRGGWVDGFSPDSEDIISVEFEDIEDISLDGNFGGESKKLQRQSTTTTNKEERTGNNLYQELQFQEPDALQEMDEGADITATDNFYGMGREVENLIMENTELLATKNALNIVKDDLIAKVDELTSEQEILREEIHSLNAVKSRLKLRIQELEEEVKKMKEDIDNRKTNKSDDEEEVPMAQRKRFTRVEMARVLMERNQYKERFMELQEAVRWTEMIRASKNDSDSDKKAKQPIWKFFSNLFSTSEKPQCRPLPYGSLQYNATANHVTPALDTMRRRGNESRGRNRNNEIFDQEFPSERLQARRANERREQYKQVRAHVKKDDGRLQAYGWSLPARGGQQSRGIPPDGTTLADHEDSPSKRQTDEKGSHVPVPVPVYCRPLMEKEPGMKIWCAAGVNLSGGRTKDGGKIYGASVFYKSNSEEGHPEEIQNSNDTDEVNQLEREIKEHEKDQREGETLEQVLSSFVWICTSTHSISKVSVIDANNPADILESFHVCSSHLLCISSVPGAKESDYSIDEDLNRVVEEALINQKMKAAQIVSGQGSSPNSNFSNDGLGVQSSSVGTLSLITCSTGSATADRVVDNCSDDADDITPVLRKEVIPCTNPEMDDDHADNSGDRPIRRLLKEPEGIVKDGVEEERSEQECEPSFVREEVEKMSSVLATMWLGSQNGSIYVHSAVRQWKRCLHSIKLKDSVLSIVHTKGRVLAALADGSVALFHRCPDGQWDLRNYHLLDLGRPHHSIRCMHVVHSNVWCGYRNKIHVINPKNMCVEISFDAHPRKESQVRQMAWIGDGVWVSIRLDSTLRLYHAHTHQHLQDVDIEPYVSKMLGTGKLGFTFVRITALQISSNRLWIGTGNGVIISVPLSESFSPLPPQESVIAGSSTQRLPGGVVRVYADPKTQTIHPGSFIPCCSMAQAQLSFHGHRDAVKFFVAVPGSGAFPFSAMNAPSSKKEDQFEEKQRNMLVISGGEGYLDFRIGENDEILPETSSESMSLSKGERSHLIVWTVAIPK